MTPSMYKERYTDMDVYTQWGATTPVSIHQYRLNSPTVGNINHKAMNDFMHKWHKGIDPKLDIRVTTGKEIAKVTPDILAKWGGYIRYAFLGKGSPELIQVVLQLAVYWDLAAYDGLQQYADDALGLDCNGFVGNYAWHIKHNHPWTELGYKKHDVGADAWIDSFLQTKYIKRWQDIDVKKSYVLALVDGAGIVIPGGTRLGHVMITEPHRFLPLVYPKPSRNQDSFALWVVECTGAHDPGLVESWYSANNLSGPVFSVNRNAMNKSKQISVKIAEIR